MDSKTAKKIDKALLKFEKEFDRLRALLYDIRADVQKHYATEKGSDS
jgi:hypothetical protein